MDAKELTGNEKIAKFMGAIVSYNPVYITSFDSNAHHFNLSYTIDDMVYNEDQLRYDSSWDWLMPVWYKFRDLRLGIDHSCYCQAIAFSICYESIDKSFDNLCKAIDWYNQNKK